MSCIFNCSNTVTAVSPQPSERPSNPTAAKAALLQHIILKSIPGSVNHGSSSPILDQPVIRLSPPKATLGFRPIPSEIDILHTELPSSSSTKTTPDEELDPHHSDEDTPLSVSTPESDFNTPNPTALKKSPIKIPVWDMDGSKTPSEEELSPRKDPEEIFSDDETPGELIISPSLKKTSRTLSDNQSNLQQPENSQPPAQTTLSFLISLNSQRR